jgi:hypothetical protein
MAQYYKNHPAHNTPNTGAGINSDDATKALPILSEYDKHCESLLSDNAEEGWASELCRYLGTMHRDVKKDANLVEWWQVRTYRYESCLLLIKVL